MNLRLRWEQRQHYASNLGRFCQSCERGGGLNPHRGMVTMVFGGVGPLQCLEGSHRSAKRMGEGVHFVEERGCQEVTHFQPRMSGWLTLTRHGLLKYSS